MAMAMAYPPTFLYSVFLFTALMLLAAAQPSTNHPCDEIYVVGEGETLHSISAKCGDPFIIDENPQIEDSDDVFPGLVIKITPPSINSRKLFFSST